MCLLQAKVYYIINEDSDIGLLAIKKMSCVSAAGERTSVFDLGRNINLKINFRTAVFNFGTAVFRSGGVSQWRGVGMSLRTHYMSGLGNKTITISIAIDT